MQTMTETRISVAKDFTPFPTGRYKRHGEGSGEDFRERVLIPALANGQSVTVDLDGVSGYPSSFLEEAFGGLVRRGYQPKDIRSRVHFKAGPAFKLYVDLIWKYVDEAVAHRQ